MTYLDKDQVLAALDEELEAAKVLPLHPMDIEGQEAHEEGIARVEWAIEFVADLPAIPLDRENLNCPDCGHRVSSHSADPDGCGSCIVGWTRRTKERDQCNCGLTEDQAEIGALRLLLRGALPVLETKKEES